MSDFEKMVNKIRNEESSIRRFIPNATHITNVALHDFPNVQHFFANLVKDSVIDIKQVGKGFQYSSDIIRNRHYAYHGLFMDYFIRKHLSNQFNIEISDGRTEFILERPDDYIIGTKRELHEAIKRHYAIFKDPKSQAMDIIKSIRIVALSHTIFFQEPLPSCEYTVNEMNLREVVKYLQSLPFTAVELNPAFDCEYFLGDADLIFDNDVIYEIKTSKYKSLTYDESEIPLSKFYQPIIYGFGFYKKTGKMIKQFKIYNPLLGFEYSIELNDIDFVLFEKVLERDVDVHCRLSEFLEKNMFLDLSLFAKEEDKIKT